MAGGGHHTQPPSSPSAGRGALAEAVGSMWSALVLGLLAAIFAWLWFGGSGESEDKGAATSQSEEKPLSTAREEGDREEQAPSGRGVQSEGLKGGGEVEKSASEAAKCQSHINAEREITEIILEPEETDIYNSKASLSSSQDFTPKLDTSASKQCDPNQKDDGNQRAPHNGPAPESAQQSDSELLNLEVPEEQCGMQAKMLHHIPTKKADQPSVKETMLYTIPSAEAVHSIGQEKAFLLNEFTTAEAVEPTLQEEIKADALQTGGALSIETLSSGTPATEAPFTSMQEGVLGVIPSDEEQPIMYKGVPNAIHILEEQLFGGQEASIYAPLTEEGPVHSLQEDGKAVQFSGQKGLMDSSGPGEIVSMQQGLSFLPTAPALHMNEVEYEHVHTEGVDYSVQEPVPDISITSEVVHFSVQEQMLETFNDLEATKSVPDMLSTYKEAHHIELDKAGQSSPLEEAGTVKHQDKMSKTEEIDAQDLLMHTVCHTLNDYDAQEKLVSGACEDVKAQANSYSDNALAVEEIISFNNSSHLSSDHCQQFHSAEPQLQNQEVDSKMRKIAAVTPMPQNVSIKFRVHYITHLDSQLIAVTGNHESLGEWNVYMPLKQDKDGFWSGSVPLPVDSSVEWKFVMMENGKIKRWEECNNRSLKTGHDDAEAHQWWGYP